jgi:hypothetical protein
VRSEIPDNPDTRARRESLLRGYLKGIFAYFPYAHIRIIRIGAKFPFVFNDQPLRVAQP